MKLNQLKKYTGKLLTNFVYVINEKNEGFQTQKLNSLRYTIQSLTDSFSLTNPECLNTFY